MSVMRSTGHNKWFENMSVCMNVSVMVVIVWTKGYLNNNIGPVLYRFVFFYLENNYFMCIQGGIGNPTNNV